MARTTTGGIESDSTPIDGGGPPVIWVEGGGGNEPPSILLSILSPGSDEDLTGPREGLPLEVMIAVTFDRAELLSLSLNISIINGSAIIGQSVEPTFHSHVVGYDIWSAVFHPRSSGQCRLGLRAKWRNTNNGTENYFSGDGAVNIAPTDWGDSKLVVNNEISPIELKDENGIGRVLLTMITPAPRQVVRASCVVWGKVYEANFRFDSGNQGTAVLELPGSSAPMPWPEQNRPAPHLRIEETDYFGETRVTFERDLATVDVTPPTIVIDQLPVGRLELVWIAAKTPVNLWFSGWMADTQSGVDRSSVSASFGDALLPIQLTPREDGYSWVAEAVADKFGQTTLTVSAKDRSTNLTYARLDINIVRSFQSTTIDELLSESRYLTELLNFTTSHLVVDRSAYPLSSPGIDDLVRDFWQEFGDVSSASVQAQDTYCNELQLPVRLLRTLVTRADVSSVQSFPSVSPDQLLAHYTFSRPAHADGNSILRNEVSSDAFSGRYVGDRPSADRPDSTGALYVDANRYAFVDESCTPDLSKLNLGQNDADFCVCFWLWMDARSPLGGLYPGLMYKGPFETDGKIINRTFGIWMRPDSNALHLEITTRDKSHEWLDSITNLTEKSWYHIVYRKAGSRLQLFLNGALDSEVLLSSPVVGNQGPLLIGRAGSPAAGGFVGLIDDVRLYARAVTEAEIQVLASPAGVCEFHQRTYESLLKGLGTSFDEFRSLRRMPVEHRAALAGRLRLEELRKDGGDALEILDDAQPGRPLRGTRAYEQWLQQVFGVPTTAPGLPVDPANATPLLLCSQQQRLTAAWAAMDAGRSIPDLDPDLVDLADLSPDAAGWRNQWKQRADELKSRQQEWRADLVTLGEVRKWRPLLEALNLDRTGLTQKLDWLRRRENEGRDIGPDLTQWGLTWPEFRALGGYADLLSSSNPETPLTLHEAEELSNLLIALWKRRTRFPVWVEEERRGFPNPTDSGGGLVPAIKLWPHRVDTYNEQAGAWQSGRSKLDFQPWRGDAAARGELEDRLAARQSAWSALKDSLSAAVAAAQGEALPLFRDALVDQLANARGTSRDLTLNHLTDRWLVEFGASGRMQTTAVRQACLALQYLVKGVLGHWFEEEHPAARWSAMPDYEKDIAGEWAWLQSYDRWQSAVLNYLYPENALWPELWDPDKSSVSTEKSAWQGFIEWLTAHQPLTVTDLLAYGEELAEDGRADAGTMDVNGQSFKRPTGLKDDEKTFFVPVAIAVAFKRAGRLREALDWFQLVYNWTLPMPGFGDGGRHRALVTKLKEPHEEPATADFFDSRWTLQLSNPHNTAGEQGAPNPYTRFVLMQVIDAYLNQAEDAFSRGSDEGRAEATGCYMQAIRLLDLGELKNVPPQASAPGGVSSQALLPNPVFESYRLSATTGLAKIRGGLSFLGSPLVQDSVRWNTGSGARAGIVKAAVHRQRQLLERAKQLASQAQQSESRYLSAMVSEGVERDRLFAAGQGVEIAGLTEKVRSLATQEAATALSIAWSQNSKTNRITKYYERESSAGLSANEERQLSAIRDAGYARVTATVAGGVSRVLAIDFHAASIVAFFESFGAKQGLAAAQALAAVTETTASAIAKENDTVASIAGIQAAHERRQQDLLHQLDVSKADEEITRIQVNAAIARKNIVDAEYKVAVVQQQHANQNVAFLNNKMLNARFYMWMVGELSQVFRTVLRLATSTAQLAEQQWQFERQQATPALIKEDYWAEAARSAASSAKLGSQAMANPQGLTASDRLLKDLLLLEDRVMATDRRLLNLSQTFSLSQYFPIDFESFRRTGSLQFSTPAHWFDEGFPGHYMRLIRRVKVSVIALTSPSAGIRATLVNGGISRVVTGDSGFPEVVIRQEPQVVSFTSPINASGVFDLDAQPDLLFPFEGSGVDTRWEFELAPAANLFDFRSIADVLFTIDYTAQFSSSLRDRVIERMDRRISSSRLVSIRSDLPDAWYEIVNSASDQIGIEFDVSKDRFPVAFSDIKVTDVVIDVHDSRGRPIHYAAKLSKSSMAPNRDSWIESKEGLISTKRIIGASQLQDWALPHAPAEDERWTLHLGNTTINSSASDRSLIERLKNGEVADILVLINYSANKPVWTPAS